MRLEIWSLMRNRTDFPRPVFEIGGGYHGGRDGDHVASRRPSFSRRTGSCSCTGSFSFLRAVSVAMLVVIALCGNFMPTQAAPEKGITD